MTVTVEEDQINTPTCSPRAFIRQYIESWVYNNLHFSPTDDASDSAFLEASLAAAASLSCSFSSSVMDRSFGSGWREPVDADPVKADPVDADPVKTAKAASSSTPSGMAGP